MQQKDETIVRQVLLKLMNVISGPHFFSLTLNKTPRNVIPTCLFEEEEPDNYLPRTNYRPMQDRGVPALNA